jgi:hypothetical protein
MLRSFVCGVVLAMALTPVAQVRAQDENARWAEVYIRQMATYQQALDNVANNRVFPLPMWPVHQMNLVSLLRITTTSWSNKTQSLVRLYAWNVPTDHQVKRALMDIYSAGETVRSQLSQFQLVDTRIVSYWNAYAPLMRMLRERFRDLPVTKDLPNPRMTAFNKLYQGQN